MISTVMKTMFTQILSEMVHVDIYFIKNNCQYTCKNNIDLIVRDLCNVPFVFSNVFHIASYFSFILLLSSKKLVLFIYVNCSFRLL